MPLRQVDNPPSPYESHAVEWLEGEAPLAGLQVIEERAKSILSENDSPDLGFRYSLNPYRGCTHACAYCYARPSHQYWGFGAGTDFERKIVVKTNAESLLRARLERADWRGELIVLSGNTDCYQPLEAAWKLTRACLQVCAEYKNPVALITKNQLVRRDLDVLTRLRQAASVSVFMSIAFADDTQSRALEPGATVPSKRFEALRALSEAGIPTGIAVAPVIPGLTDAQIPELLARAKQAGAKHAFMTPLRLPREVGEVFESRLREVLPGYADKVMSQVLQIRGGKGKKNDARFGERMRGQGPRFAMIEDLFVLHCARQGLSREMDALIPNTFERPRAQLALF